MRNKVVDKITAHYDNGDTKRVESLANDVLALAAESLKEFCLHVMHPDSDLHKDADQWINDNLK